MNFYDITGVGFKIPENLHKALGFARIAIPPTDLSVVNIDTEKSHGARVVYGSRRERLLENVRRGAIAVAITDFYVDKKLLEAMKINDTILLIPLNSITAVEGGERSRNAYRAASLIKHARSLDLRLSFATMAASADQLLSYPQMVEVARMAGADRQYARYGISSINKEIIGI